MEKKELLKAFREKLITKEQLKEKLFEIEEAPKVKRKSRKLPHALKEEEFAKLLKCTRKQVHKVAFLLAFASGMRISEVLKLEQHDIDFEKKSILIREGKGGKDRVVPLPKGFRKEFLDEIPIPEQCGERALEAAFKRNAKRAGLLKDKPDLHFHNLRHSFASNCVARGVPIHHVRTLLGHANISTTNIYLEMNPTEALKSYEQYF